MTLRDAIKERDAQRQADSIIQASKIARQQKIDTTAALLLIQGNYPNGIPAVLSNRDVFIDVGNKLETLMGLNARLVSWKASLTALKTEVHDADFEADIQTEINLIP